MKQYVESANSPAKGSGLGRGGRVEAVEEIWHRGNVPVNVAASWPSGARPFGD